jgi:hypothetical protein
MALFELGSINKQYNSQTETFRYSFNLTHNGFPLFNKYFDGSDTTITNIAADIITIPNHFFITGEPLYYNAGIGGTAISIDPSSPGVGGATTLPQKVYAIKIDENKIRVSAASSLAFLGSQINMTSVGIGTSHFFTAEKQNTKCIIALDNVIQSPLYPRIGYATTLVSINNRVLELYDSSYFKNYDLIKIKDEIMRIQVIGFNGNPNQILVDRAWMGTVPDGQSPGDYVQLLLGDYNIIKDTISFADIPFGGYKQTIGVSSSSINLSTNSFTYLTDLFETGSQIRTRSLQPPLPIQSNADYFIIKNSANNFSFASSKNNALIGIAITLTTAGIGTHFLTYTDITNGSSFQGRSFIRSNYDGNLIIDDISEKFTGIGKTFLIQSSGIHTTGISTDYGSILVNNIFQKPEIDYNFVGIGTTSVNIVFNGNSNIPEGEIYSTYDVNANKLPRKGIIVSIGNSQGYGYQPRYVGTGTAIISGFGTVSVAIGYSGSGYRNGTNYKIFVDGGNSISGAAGTFSTLNGMIDKIFMSSPGVGYTWTNVPKIIFDNPIPYDDIQLISLSTGIGASVSIVVGSGLSITQVQLNNLGYGYTVGEQLRIAGIPTDSSVGVNFKDAIFTVKETRTDEFAGWVFGKLQVLDDFSNEFDGKKTIFTIKENGTVLSIDKKDGSPIKLANNLLIFINDILQKPEESYNFDGGTQISFTEPPEFGSTLQVLFYRGTDSDVTIDTALQSVKVGDTLKISHNPNYITPVDQEERIIKEIIKRDSVSTPNYTQQGISAAIFPLRPVEWCKQQRDIVINGQIISKARDSYKSRIYPSTRIIKSISTSDNIFYADSGEIIFDVTEDPNTTNFNIKIIDSDKDNSGFGTTTFTMPIEIVNGVSISGDNGIIAGIGITSMGIQFHFYLPTNSPLTQNPFGGLQKTGISTGDYFIISRSNVGNGIISLSNVGFTTIGIATEFLDGVYQVSDLQSVGSGRTMIVTAKVQGTNGFNASGLGSGSGNYYGEYSWAKFTSSRSIGLAFTCNTLSGLSGLSTSPQIIRTTELSVDYS